MKPAVPRSIFPIQLLMAYFLIFSLAPTFIFFSDSSDVAASLRDWNRILGWSLFLCVPLLWVFFMAVRHFRKMPVFASTAIIYVIWHFVTTYTMYRTGFDIRFGFDLKLQNFVRDAVVFAVPFVIVYIYWASSGPGTKSTSQL